MKQVTRKGWLARLALAEAVGIAAVAATYAVIDRGLIGAQVWPVLAAGGVEGLCLGLAQASGLRRLGVRPGPWVGLTMLAAVLGYGLSLLGQMGGEQAAADTIANSADPPLWLMALAGGGVGLGMGAVMGLIQAPALPRGIPVWRWVLANLLGWIPAMAAIMLAASLAERSWPLSSVAVLGAASGAVAGLCVAWATWPCLAKASR